MSSCDPMLCRVSYTLPFTGTSTHETPLPHRRRHDSIGGAA
jgi:hypothetical protein